MESSKQEGVSRQSSILKLPKQRQPLQCVAANSSSSENSPTVKIKRRVSFAKNRHIREFCNEAEQETVWDNTYEEEHDLSSTKNSSNENEPLIISIPCDDKENFPVELFFKNNELECREVQGSAPSEEGDNLQQYDMEMDVSINNLKQQNTETENQDAEYPNATIYCDEGMDITMPIQPNIIPCRNQSSSSLEDTVLVSQNCTQNAAIDIMESLHVNLFRNPGINKKFDANSASNSTELTQAISMLLKTGNSSKPTNQIDLENVNHVEESLIEKTDYLNNLSTMEFISVLPSSTWIRPESKCQNDEKSDNFITKTMEFTLAVPNYNIYSNQNKDKIIDSCEKTKIFPNKSMEMTEAISTYKEIHPQLSSKTNIITNESMEMSGAVPKTMEFTLSVPSNNIHSHQSKDNIINSSEKTRIFPDKLMEMTEAISTYKQIHPQLSDKTNIVATESMEMSGAIPKTMEFTLAVPNYNIHSNQNKDKIIDPSEKTKIFPNKSMEMTEAISTYKEIRPQLSDKTNIVANESMEMSGAVPKTMEFTLSVPCNNIHSHQSKDNIINSSEKTRSFPDKLMEMTEAISTYKQIHPQLSDKTNIVATESMEMSGAIPKTMEFTLAVPNYNIHSNQNKDKIIDPSEKTKIFPNKSMEMTEAISTYKEIRPQLSDKTNIVANESMEMSGAVPKTMEFTLSVPCNNIHSHQSKDNIINSSEKTRSFPDKLMEMTEAISTYKQIHPQLSDKTNIVANESMEMSGAVAKTMEFTLAVPNYNIHSNQNKDKIIDPSEKTKIFANKSMEMTEAISTYKEIRPQLSDKSNIVANESMEMSRAFPKTMEFTLAVPNNNIHSYQNKDKIIAASEKTKIFPNKSMEMTEAVSTYKEIHLELSDKTNIVATESMEMPGAIPKTMEFTLVVPNNNIRSDQNKDKIIDSSEKTKIFPNKSMEMTEAVSTYKEIRPQLSDKTKFFDNKSMEITEANGKTNILANNLMEMIEAFPVYINKEKSNCNVEKVSDKIADEKTNFFANNSMEITGIIPIYNEIYQSNNNTNKIQRKSMQRRSKTFYTKPIETAELVSVPSMTNAANNVFKSLDAVKEPQELVQEKIVTSQQTNPSLKSDSQSIPNDLQEKTTIFVDKPMDMTEMIATYKNYLSSVGKTINIGTSEATQLFSTSPMDITKGVSTLPPVAKSYPKSAENVNHDYSSHKEKNVGTKKQNSSTIQVYHDDSMEMTGKLPVLQTVVRSFTTQSENDSKNKNTDHLIRAGSSNFNSSCNGSYNKNSNIISNNVKNDQSEHRSELTLHDAAAQFLTVPAISSANSSKKLNHYSNQSILSNKLDDLQRSMNVSNNCERDNNYDIIERNSSREETFHGLTSDELNTLCASMNLPTQKYTQDESISTQNSYIPSACNNVNVLRDSLEKNSIFQQSNSTSKSNYNSEENDNVHIIETVGKNVDRGNSRVLCDMDTREQSLIQLQKEETNNIPTPMEFSEIYKNPTDKSAIMQDNFDTSLRTDILCKSFTNSVIAMETDKTTELNQQHLENQQTKHLNQPIDQINHVPCSVNLSAVQGYPVSESVMIHQNLNISTQNANNSCAIKSVSTDLETNQIVQNNDHKKLPSSKIQIYHEVSMDLAIAPSTAKKKYDFRETEEFINRNNIISNMIGSAHTSMEISENSDKGKNDTISADNSLSRLPSDNTDVLLATMGCKAKLPYPLVINEKTIIHVSHKSFIDKTYTLSTNLNIENQVESNKTYIVDKNIDINNQVEPNLIDDPELKKNKKVIPNVKISDVSNHTELNLGKKECKILDTENKEYYIKENFSTEKYSHELEEIQPPSFLYSDSLQDNTNESALKDDQLDASTNSLNEKNVNILLSETEGHAKIRYSDDFKQNPTNDLKKLISGNTNFLQEETKTKNSTKVSSSKKNNIVQIIEPVYENKEDPIEEPITPFLSLTENLKAYEKRNECIWTIQTISPKMIAIDFITKSFIVIIRLNEFEKACNKDIEKIEIISRLSANPKNILLRIVHNLLLTKLKPIEMLDTYKMYEDILPLLEYMSSEVLFAMNFKFDFERLNALNILNIDHERISFMVSSRKANIILKVSLLIKVFNEIGPEDIDVTCILGDIRKSDIKQLIVNIRRDYKFLSRYINDVKDYITLMEESTFLNRY